jgi:hypothetical protein
MDDREFQKHGLKPGNYGSGAKTWSLPRPRKLTDDELAERDRRLDLAMDTEDERDD